MPPSLNITGTSSKYSGQAHVPRMPENQRNPRRTPHFLSDSEEHQTCENVPNPSLKNIKPHTHMTLSKRYRAHDERMTHKQFENIYTRTKKCFGARRHTACPLVASGREQLQLTLSQPQKQTCEQTLTTKTGMEMRGHREQSPMASAAAVPSSRSEAFATSRPVRSVTIVW